jgi:hypothetical protein
MKFSGWNHETPLHPTANRTILLRTVRNRRVNYRKQTVSQRLAKQASPHAQQPANSRALHGLSPMPSAQAGPFMLKIKITTSIHRASGGRRPAATGFQSLVDPFHILCPEPADHFGSQIPESRTPAHLVRQTTPLNWQRRGSGDVRTDSLLVTGGGY